MSEWRRLHLYSVTMLLGRCTCGSSREKAGPGQEGRQTGPSKESSQEGPSKEGSQARAGQEGRQADWSQKGSQAGPGQEGRQEGPSKEGSASRPGQEGRQADDCKEGSPSSPGSQGGSLEVGSSFLWGRVKSGACGPPTLQLWGLHVGDEVKALALGDSCEGSMFSELT